MRRPDDDRSLQEWEALLKRGLDQISDLGDEEPPNLGALQMLVVDVQAAQRRRLYGDLLWFWGVGAALLCGVVWLGQQEPAYFLALQGAVALLALMGAGAWCAFRGWRTEWS